ncbi:MAG: hypothetical protein LC131_08765 [Anaerolineae bacterium]|nr:hypothetical protein [Anaerolineae bacterium]
MEDNRFLMNAWRTVAAAFAVLVLTIGGCSAYRSSLVADMVKAGADPIKAHCAIFGIGSNDAAMCGAAAASR